MKEANQIGIYNSSLLGVSNIRHLICLFTCNLSENKELIISRFCRGTNSSALHLALGRIDAILMNKYGNLQLIYSENRD